ncbi:MAG: DnaB-like helicase C-terminal domain-containing protein [Dehalococcoidales bacterium]
MTQRRTQYQTQDASHFFLHTPAESSSRYVEWAERLSEDPGITFGCVLDKYIIPLHPGDLMSVVARPGHGKSMFMAYLTRRVANQIVARGATGKECAVYVSWEQPVEELEAYFQSGASYTSTDLAWGRVDLDTVRKGAIDRINLPVWMVGYSIRDSSVAKPPLTVDMVYNTIRSLRDEFGLSPALVCLDYLQIIPVHHAGERTRQVSNATIEAKRLAMDVGCPIVAGVQAGRQVDKYASPIPALADGQHTSTIEQTADKQIALWRPIKTEEPGEGVNVGGVTYDVVEELLVVRLLKQRLESGSGIWPIHFKPETLEVKDYAIHSL